MIQYVLQVDVSQDALNLETLERIKPNQKQLLTNFLLRMNFSEILISEDLDLDYIIDEWHPLLKKQTSTLFHYQSCLEQIYSYYSIVSLEGIGYFSKGEIIAAGVLLSYLKLTQCGKCHFFL